LFCTLEANDVGYRSELVPIRDEEMLEEVKAQFIPKTMYAKVSSLEKDESMRAYQENADDTLRYFNEKQAPDECKQKIVDEISKVMEKLKTIGYKIDIENIKSKITNMIITLATWEDEEVFGFYIPDNNEVVFDRNLIENLENQNNYRIFMHVMLHGIAGREYADSTFVNNSRLYAVREAKIDNIVDDVQELMFTSNNSVTPQEGGVANG